MRLSTQIRQTVSAGLQAINFDAVVSSGLVSVLLESDCIEVIIYHFHVDNTLQAQPFPLQSGFSLSEIDREVNSLSLEILHFCLTSPG